MRVLSEHSSLFHAPTRRKHKSNFDEIVGIIKASERRLLSESQLNKFKALLQETEYSRFQAHRSSDNLEEKGFTFMCFAAKYSHDLNTIRLIHADKSSLYELLPYGPYKGWTLAMIAAAHANHVFLEFLSEVYPRLSSTASENRAQSSSNYSFFGFERNNHDALPQLPSEDGNNFDTSLTQL